MKKFILILLVLSDRHAFCQVQRVEMVPGTGAATTQSVAFLTNSANATNIVTGVNNINGGPKYNWVTINSPTTIAGYGITDPIVYSTGAYSDPAWITALAWSKVTGRPTTISGYGITDPIIYSSGSYSNPSWLTALAWSKVTGTPTTLAGYGITDADSIGAAAAAQAYAIQRVNHTGPEPYNEETLSADKTLIASSPLIQILSPATTNRNVNLPVLGSISGLNFNIVHGGASNALIIKDSSGTQQAKLFPGWVSFFTARNSTWQAVVVAPETIGTYSTATTLSNETFVKASGTTSLTLPAPSDRLGVPIYIKNVGTNTVTVNPSASETIDGLSSVTLTSQYEGLEFQTDGTNWFLR